MNKPPQYQHKNLFYKRKALYKFKTLLAFQEIGNELKGSESKSPDIKSRTWVNSFIKANSKWKEKVQYTSDYFKFTCGENQPNNSMNKTKLRVKIF